MPFEPTPGPPVGGQDYWLADEYSRRSRPNPGPLHVAPDEAPPKRRDRLGVLAVLAAEVALLITGIAIGRALAAPRSGQTTERFDLSPPSSAALSGAPRPEAEQRRPGPGEA